MADIKQWLKSQFPVLESERLILRRLEPGDIEALYSCMTDPAVLRHTAVGPAKLLFPDRLYRYFEEAYRSLRDLHFVLEHKHEHHLIGLCSLQYWTPSSGQARLGYMVSPLYWNQGLATEAVKTVFEFGHDTLGLTKVEARCSADNPASEHVLQKCGMCYISHLPASKGLNGEEIPVKLYRREWEKGE
ncbi:GNAT family N-acetyltransferase [Paenibacillus puldeungensis]|uniref:GNAT family N-acetyltransferase n=1 Tax=Paenibacillus puldeungensis TaxID=696536 RepID=A0ABW3S1K4_9BACL